MGKSPSIEHKITYSKKGSRSEARHGHLFIDGQEVADIFTLIISQDEAFKFLQRTQPWGNDGFWPVDKKKLDDWKKFTYKRIDNSILKKGWYRGKELLKGTPSYWLYVEWKGGTAYVSPLAIADMAKALDLKPIPRMKGFSTLIRK